MAVTATVLGTATGGGVDLTIPITVDQPAGSIVALVTAAYTGPEHFFESQGFRSVPTDSQGGTWDFNSPHPWIGNTGDATGTFGVDAVFGNIMGASRTAGPDLSGGGGAGGGRSPKPGCTTCGSELMGLLMRPGGGAGDSVTVHYFNTNSVDPSPTLGIVLAFEGAQNLKELTDQSPYGNGDAYPSSGGPANTLNWQADLGLASVPKVTNDCAIYTGASAYGTSGWTPVNGSTIASISAGGAGLAVSFFDAMLAGVRTEPGGSFGGAGQILVANYQTVKVL